MALGEFLEPLHEPPTGPRPRIEDFQPPVEALARLRTRCLAVGGVAALISLVGFFFAPRATFLRAYLVGWLYALGAAAGCLAILMLHHMSRGAWGLVVRRVLEAGDAHAAGAGAPLPADRPRRAAPLRVGAPRGGGERSAPPVQAVVSEPAVLRRPLGARPRAVGARRLHPQPHVAPPGRDRRPGPLPPHAERGGAGDRALRPHRHARGRRLADVARPALVLEHLRAPLRDQPGI